MVRDLHSNLHIEAMRSVHSTFISDFAVGTHKLEAEPKLWDSTMEIGKTTAGETGVHKSKELNTKKFNKRRRRR
jgi:hypothetical protein